MTTFTNSREIPASPEQIFAAFRNPERLARWWGPNGFTNTFQVCEFVMGGRWSFVMHGPNGADYPNDCVFAKIDAPERLVIHHISAPVFRLTITLSASGSGTTVAWAQEFDSEELAAQLKSIVVPANEQNLERLAEEINRSK